MPETTQEENWYPHFHQTLITEMTVLVGEEIGAPSEPTQRKLAESHSATLKQILEELKDDNPDPTSGFQKGLKALDKIDKERFLIENLLEAVKRGESLKDTLKKYNYLGLTNINVDHGPDVPPAMPPSSMGAGVLLRRFSDRLKKLATKVAQGVVHAMKAIPKFVGMKPSIGVAGPFPTLSFQISLEVEWLTLASFFQTLTKSWIAPEQAM
jgi:hypothetical protein